MTINVRGDRDHLDLRDWTDPCIEPSLAEILSDPMTELVFRRDHLRRDNVEHFLRDLASRLESRTFPCPSSCSGQSLVA